MERETLIKLRATKLDLVEGIRVLSEPAKPELRQNLAPFFEHIGLIMPEICVWENEKDVAHVLLPDQNQKHSFC
jgi:hypothetical protein